MPIARDLSDLPKGESDGDAPVSDPLIGPAIAKWWLDQHDQEERSRALPELPFRFSSAASCTRQLAYQFTGTPETNPPDEADTWRMNLGSLAHDWIAPALADRFPDAEISTEVLCDGRPHIDGSGHADALVVFPNGKRVVVEAKTVNGFGFKMMATHFKGAPEGPRAAHIAQGALYARALEADELRIAYLSLELVSPQLSRYADDPVFGRFCAEWAYTPAEFMPIAEREDRRVRFVLDRLDGRTGGDAAKAVARFIDDDRFGTVEVRNPKKGAWEHHAPDGTLLGAGEKWNCGYCRFQDRCVADG